MRFFQKKKTVRLVEFLYDYCNVTKRGATHIRYYRRLARMIEEFEKHIQQEIFTNSFDEEIVGEYIHFLRSYEPEKQCSGFKQTTVRNYYSKTVAALNKAERQGWAVKTSAFHEFSIKEEESRAVYLNMDELAALNALELDGEVRQVRDIFLVGCFTGLRYSDYSRLSEENFLDGNITILTKKTETKVTIPIHSMIKEIIDRNGGYGFLKYKYSQQSFNKSIKAICKKAGMVDKVMLEYTRGFDKIREVYKKYELVSTHTARRTAATNMYLAGIPTFRIMLITGHKSESAFYRYIRIQKEENAKDLQNHAFFTSASVSK